MSIYVFGRDTASGLQHLKGFWLTLIFAPHGSPDLLCTVLRGSDLGKTVPILLVVSQRSLLQRVLCGVETTAKPRPRQSGGEFRGWL